MENKISSVREFLSSVDGSIQDVCATVFFNYLNNDECTDADGANILQCLFNWDCKSDKTLKLEAVYSAEEYESMSKETQSMISKIVSNLVAKNVEEETFYQDLWTAIKQDIFFSSERDKIGAIVSLYFNKMIPYYKLPEGLKMDDVEFREISESSIDLIKKFVFAINGGYNQKTEVASLLLHDLTEISDEKQKVVLIANILGCYERKVIGVIEQLKKKMEQLEDLNNDES